MFFNKRHIQTVEVFFKMLNKLSAIFKSAADCNRLQRGSLVRNSTNCDVGKNDRKDKEYKNVDDGSEGRWVMRKRTFYCQKEYFWTISEKHVQKQSVYLRCRKTLETLSVSKMLERL